jgi:hypothetical protein
MKLDMLSNILKDIQRNKNWKRKSIIKITYTDYKWHFLYWLLNEHTTVSNTDNYWKVELHYLHDNLFPSPD